MGDKLYTNIALVVSFEKTSFGWGDDDDDDDRERKNNIQSKFKSVRGVSCANRVISC